MKGSGVEQGGFRKGLVASNEEIFQFSFRVLLFSREVFESMKFTKLK